MEATNSRINLKKGAEKLPFSLVGTDLSLWQEQPGDWRIRLRGQPARTDLSLDLADTGIVRLEAQARRAPELRQMPIHLDLEWQEAQLGQLMRLVIGSDPGWRGDLTGELHLDGTADAAEIKTRLRATGVHRAEFAPAAPMDFDASCSLFYHFSERVVENLVCDSPLGDGRIRVAGDMPRNGASPRLSVELDRIPVGAGLDALRTVRSNFAPGLEVKGSISGKISYSANAPEANPAGRTVSRGGRNKPNATKAHPAQSGPLTGSVTVEGLQLTSEALSTPVLAPRLVLEPVVAALPAQGQPPGGSPGSGDLAALETMAAIPAGGSSPLSITARLALSGYQVTLHGQASVARARELAHAAGISGAAALDSLAGDPVTVDLGASGPWLAAPDAPFASRPAAADVAPHAPDVAIGAPGARPAAVAATPPASDRSDRIDRLSGTVTLHNANWKADYLANPMDLTQATLHLGNGELRWDGVIFSYGPVNGTASLNLQANCATVEPCLPRFQVQFRDLNSSALQAAILGAHEPGKLLSSLIAEFKSSASTAWPQLEGTVKADSLTLGPVTLTNATATLRILSNGAEITGLDADLLGGHVHGGGTLRTAGAGQAAPAYTLEGRFEKLSPAEVGQLLGLTWSGRTIDGDGRIDLSGFTGKDLAGSAKGTLHFDWRHGAVAEPGDAASGDDAVPPQLAQFDRWTADSEIADGAITLKENQVQQGSQKGTVGARLTLGDPPRVNFSVPKETQARR
jgi:hypothetical protein